MFKKLATVLAIFATALFILPGAHAGDRGRSHGEATRQFRLGEIMLSVIGPSANREYLFSFTSDHRELLACQCAFKTHEPRTVTGAPLPHCRTLLAYCFSGGAHCCTTLFIATQCGHVDSLDMVDLGHTDAQVQFIRVEGASGKVIKVQDWQFAYYGPEDSQIQLSFADSPAMTRLLVFEKGHWRADRVGEFSRFYSRLLHEAVRDARLSARRQRPELAASLAMKAAYYNLMSGEPVEKAEEVLRRFFPPEWKSGAGKVVQDICRGVSEFDPVEALR